MEKKNGKILVVDDNLGIRQALKILLPMYFEAVETIPSPSTLVSTLESFRPCSSSMSYLVTVGPLVTEVTGEFIPKLASALSSLTLLLLIYSPVSPPEAV